MKSTQKSIVAEYTIDDLLPIGLTIAVLGITMSFVGDVQNDIRSDQTASSLAYNISTYGMQGTETVSKKIPTVAKVVIAGIIIGILIRFMAFGKQ